MKTLLASLIAFIIFGGCHAQTQGSFFVSTDSEYVAMEHLNGDSAVNFICNEVIVAKVLPNDSLVIFDSLKTIKVLMNLLLSQMERTEMQLPQYWRQDQDDLNSPYPGLTDTPSLYIKED